MKKFRYSMESLLQIKLKLEEQMKIAYGIASRNLNIEEEKLEQLIQRKAEYEKQLRLLRSDKLDLMKIKECEQAIEIMKAKISQQEAVVRNARHKLELARIRLNEAIINRKIQEKLKENELQEYILEFEAEERKEVDELNSYNYTGPRKSKEDE